MFWFIPYMPRLSSKVGRLGSHRRQQYCQRCCHCQHAIHNVHWQLLTAPCTREINEQKVYNSSRKQTCSLKYKNLIFKNFAKINIFTSCWKWVGFDQGWEECERASWPYLKQWSLDRGARNVLLKSVSIIWFSDNWRILKCLTQI